MNILNSSRVLARTILVGSAVAASLSAQAVTLKFLGTGEGRNVKISTNGGTSFKAVFSGVLRMQEVGPPQKDFFGFCATAHVNMINSNYGATKTTSGSIGGIGLTVGHIVNSVAPGVFGLPNGNPKKDQAAALQLVIWEMLSENTETNFSFTSGSFQAKNTNDSAISGDVLNLANQYASMIGSSEAIYYAAAMSGNQLVSQSILTPVPEPATLSALALGALATLRRRNKR